MKIFVTANEVLPPDQKAVVVFTRGERLGFDNRGLGGIGNWRTNLEKLEKVDKVIIYLREEGQSGGQIYLGNYLGYNPSPQKGRYIIYFSRLKLIGTTSSNWFEFGKSQTNPIGFVGDF